MNEATAVPLTVIGAQLIAGLGLFFAGIRMLSDNLRRLADHRLQTMISQLTSTGRGAAALGLVGGALVQSMNAMVFVLISLVKAGVMDVRRAHPIINFANLGSSALVVLAAFKPKLLILASVGIAGVMYYAERDRNASSSYALRALMGIGLLFLGLTFIKDLGEMISQSPWLEVLISESASSFLVAFAMGGIIAFLVHSASSVTIVTMAFAAGGAVDLEHAMLAVFGAALGVSLSTLALGTGHRGFAQQLILYQFSLKILGLLLVLPLAAAELIWGIPLLAAGISALPGSVSLHVAFVYLIYQLACDLVMEPLHGKVTAFIERRAPQTSAEELGQLRFLYQGAESDPATAVVLVDREQQRMVELLPAYLDSVRSEVGETTYEIDPLHQGCSHLSDVCSRFLEGLMSSSLSEDSMERTLVLHNRNQLLAGLQESLYELAPQVARVRGEDAGEAGRLIDTLVESLHMLLLTLNDAALHGQAQDVALLRDLTGDRSELMAAIRRRVLADSSMEATRRDALLSAVSLFERLVWLLRRYALLLVPEPANSERGSS